MPVGAAGVGANVGVASGAGGSALAPCAGSVFVLAIGEAFGVADGDPPGDGLAAGRADNALSIATKASEFESGDHTRVSGKCTAIVSDVTFLSSLPSGV